VTEPSPGQTSIQESSTSESNLIPIAEPPIPPPAIALNYAEVRHERSREVGENPVAWRELRKPSFARSWKRWVFLGVTGGILLWIYYLAIENLWQPNQDVHTLFLALYYTALLGCGCVVSASIVAQEKGADTWALLLTTPLSGRQILLGKLLGVARRLIPFLALPIAHCILFAGFGVISITACLSCVAVMLAFPLIWIVSGLALSLLFRNPTTAVIVNLALPLALYVGVPLTLQLVSYLVFDEYLLDLSSLYQPWFYLDKSLDAFEHSMSWGKNSTVSFRPFGRAARISGLDFLAVLVTIIFLHACGAFLLFRLLCKRFDWITGRTGTR
jgi:ABC-type transport system involved in multi-copper enzyme maturation permease subunit